MNMGIKIGKILVIRIRCRFGIVDNIVTYHWSVATRILTRETIHVYRRRERLQR